jgi:two-component SAPR family response regulator
MEGLKWAKRLVEADPLCEAGYRLLMICCALVGNRSEIPRLFEKLNKKLQTYYKITADNKTVLLKETLLSGRTPEEKLWNEETII